MSHYITAQQGKRPVILAGPYKSESLAWDDIAKAYEHARTFYDAKDLTLYGVEHLPGFKTPGRLNLRGFSASS
tara:strand:- start:651 stop:869 length:219 start_codon:yes stop_codon:yes gene_type:complete